MDTKELIEKLGGPNKVIADTGLTKGRISQWVTANRITPHWLKFLQLKYKRKINWQEYSGKPD